MTDLVRLVFDTSAVLAYAGGSIHAGEVLAELIDGGTRAAVPVACLVEASLTASDSDRLHVLAEHPAVTLVGVEPSNWQHLAGLADLTGGFATATAALHALDEDCWVLSARPWLYEHIMGGELAIAVDD